MNICSQRDGWPGLRLKAVHTTGMSTLTSSKVIQVFAWGPVCSLLGRATNACLATCTSA